MAAASFDLKGFHTRYSSFMGLPSAPTGPSTWMRFSPYTSLPASIQSWGKTVSEWWCEIIIRGVRDLQGQHVISDNMTQSAEHTERKIVAYTLRSREWYVLQSDYMRNWPGVELRVTRASSFDLAINTPSCLCASMITFAPPFNPPPRPLDTISFSILIGLFLE